MQLQLSSCADHLDLSISNQSSFDQCEEGRTFRRMPAESIAGCGAGAHSRVSVRNSDPTMITSASPETSVTGGACTIGSWSNPSADLNDSPHLAVNRHNDSPLVSSSRQPRMMFSSSSGATADHERGSWSPARCYACSFCGREFNSAQALGGHMNIHRRDRARLRTSTSPGASIPHDQADLPPFFYNTSQYSDPSTRYESLMNEAACRESANTAISSGPNVTYKSPNIISATPTFSLLNKIPPAPDPTLLALAAYSSQEENLAPPFSVPLVDLAPLVNGSTRRSSCAARFSKFQSEAHSLSSTIAPHASLVFARPKVESSSLKHGEAVQMITGQGSVASPLARPDCEAASTAQLIQISQSTGRAKRAREDADGVNGAAARSTAGQSSRHERSSLEKSNSPYAARPFDVRPSTPAVKGLSCLDLELRLGQSLPSDADARAGECCRPWTTATTTAPAPARPTRL